MKLIGGIAALAVFAIVATMLGANAGAAQNYETMRGKMEPRGKLRFKLVEKKGKVRLDDVRVGFRCGEPEERSGVTFGSDPGDPIRLDRQGRFSHSAVDKEIGFEFKFKGDLNRRLTNGEGTFRWQGTTFEGFECDTGRLTWTAELRV